MGVMAQWRDMRWEVSPRVVTAISSISSSIKLAKESQNDRDGSNPTNIKGLEAQTIPVEYDVAAAVGRSPRTEFETWVKRVGKKGTLVLGGRRFGPSNLQLDEVKLNASQIDGTGTILVGTISLSFVQDGKTKKTTGNSSSTGITSGAAPTSALNVGPTKQAILSKKG